MKTYKIKVNESFVTVTGDSAEVVTPGTLFIKASDEVVFSAASGHWSYFEIQTHNIEKLAKAG